MLRLILLVQRPLLPVGFALNQSSTALSLDFFSHPRLTF
jgi:hypothetical protein